MNASESDNDSNGHLAAKRSRFWATAIGAKAAVAGRPGVTQHGFHFPVGAYRILPLITPHNQNSAEPNAPHQPLAYIRCHPSFMRAVIHTSST